MLTSIYSLTQVITALPMPQKTGLWKQTSFNIKLKLFQWFHMIWNVSVYAVVCQRGDLSIDETVEHQPNAQRYTERQEVSNVDKRTKKI